MSKSLTLLSLLAANDQLGSPELHRTVLMKQAFLAETLRPLYRLWRKTFSFVRYHYGPFSDELFEHLNALVFNGLAEVTTFHQSGSRTEARYRITAGGKRFLKRACDSQLLELATDLVWALQSLGIEQAGAISRLVYQELEFSKLLLEHQKSGIPATSRVGLPTVTDASNETFIVLALLKHLTDQGEKRIAKGATSVHSKTVVRLFLNFLAARAATA
jgi:DNA-binding PadR family transcriptional regulator